MQKSLSNSSSQMNIDMERNGENLRALVAFVFVLILLVAILCNASCSTAKHIDKADTVYVTKAIYENNIQYDSIYIDVYHDRFIKGDTMYYRVDSIVYRYLLKQDTILKTDTCYLSKTDIQTKVIEKKKLVWWPCIVAILVGICVFCYEKTWQKCRK